MVAAVQQRNSGWWWNKQPQHQIKPVVKEKPVVVRSEPKITKSMALQLCAILVPVTAAAVAPSPILTGRIVGLVSLAGSTFLTHNIIKKWRAGKIKEAAKSTTLALAAAITGAIFIHASIGKESESSVSVDQCKCSVLMDALGEIRSELAALKQQSSVSALVGQNTIPAGASIVHLHLGT